MVFKQHHMVFKKNYDFHGNSLKISSSVRSHVHSTEKVYTLPSEGD